MFFARFAENTRLLSAEPCTGQAPRSCAPALRVSKRISSRTRAIEILARTAQKSIPGIDTPEQRRGTRTTKKPWKTFAGKPPQESLHSEKHCLVSHGRGGRGPARSAAGAECALQTELRGSTLNPV